MFDDFFNGYLECSIWASSEEVENMTIEDFDENTLDKMKESCFDFFEKNNELLTKVNDDFSQHGHDFWLTRNGHGAGFWDRDYGDDGDTLSEIAKGYGELYLCKGDDGKIYVSG